MGVHAHSVTAAVDPTDVWERWTTIEDWPATNPRFRKAQLNGPLAKGALGWVKPARGRQWTFRIVEVDRKNMRFAVETRRLLATVTLEHVLERPAEGDPASDERVLTHRVRTVGPLAALWDRLVGKPIADAQPAVLESIVVAASSGSD